MNSSLFFCVSDLIGISFFHVVFSFLFFCSLCAMSIRRTHVIFLVLSIELMLMSVNLQLVTSSTIQDDLIGKILVLFIFTVAASEAAIGLAIMIVYYRLQGTISLNYISGLKG